MKAFFSSLKAGYLFFGLLALVFGIGSYLASIPKFKEIFKEMTATHAGHCLDAIVSEPVMLIWMTGFLLAGACLFINTWYCTIAQTAVSLQTRKQQGGFKNQQHQMAWIHIAALLVILCHAMDISLVQRHKPVRLYPGQAMEMGGYKVRVKQINYTADPCLVTEDESGRKRKIVHLSREEFHIRDNYAVIEIEKDMNRMDVKELRLLAPARMGATFFFLDGFFIAHKQTRIGVEIHHSYNPLVFVFFIIYTILLSLLVFRFFTRPWKNRKKNELSSGRFI